MYIDKLGNKWYKGNLHTHTTVSDGIKSPADTKALYRSLGYDFIALTDHFKYGEGSEDDPSGLLVLSGAEYDHGADDSVGGVFHIVGIGTDENPNIERGTKMQDAVDMINAHGGLAILAHPAWSLNTYDMIMEFHGLFATEIYNSLSGFPRNCRPYSGLVIDELAARGYVLPLIADDDTHFHSGEVGMSYIMVNLGDKPLNKENLMAALRAGRFIATQGPFFMVYRDGDEIIVRSETPMKVVTFFTNRPWEGTRNIFAEDEPLYEASYIIHPHDTFVRVEITDYDGNVGFAKIIEV